MYELEVNENDEIILLFKIEGIEHTLGITERDLRAFTHLFKMYNLK
jgi:hypothetical protein